MINLIQPITVQQAYDGITHSRRWASWNWWWRMVDDDDGDESPSLEPWTDSRSDLLRGFRAWRRLRIVKRDDFFSSIFFLFESKYIELELASEGIQGTHEVGGAPPREKGVAPLVFIFGVDFLLFFSKMFRGVSGHSENFCFLHIKQHHGNSAENNVSLG